MMWNCWPGGGHVIRSPGSPVAAREPPVDLSRLRPVGGALDAYLCYPGQEAVWHEQWSRVLNADGSVVANRKKGYAEVAW